MRGCDSILWGRRATRIFPIVPQSLTMSQSISRAPRSPACRRAAPVAILKKNLPPDSPKRCEPPLGLTVPVDPLQWFFLLSRGEGGEFRLHHMGRSIAATRTFQLNSPRFASGLDRWGRPGSLRVPIGSLVDARQNPSRSWPDGVTLRFRPPATGPWCNGSTAVFGTACPSSNLGGPIAGSRNSSSLVRSDARFS